MKIHFCDRNVAVTDALSRAFERVEDVTVTNASIFDVPVAEAIVSPANSFAYLDGGIDGVYGLRWPWMQGVIQKAIQDSHYGELPVGQALVVPIHMPAKEGDYNWFISAPTMRVPMDIRGTVNAYLAFRAALIAASGFDSITCPGMGTAVGRLSPEIAATQMLTAYRQVIQGVRWSPDENEGLGYYVYLHQNMIGR